MKIGNLIGLSLLIAGIVGVGYGFSLTANPEQDESALGVIMITGSTFFPISGALFYRTKNPTELNNWLSKEARFG